jgi:hypothetical protein
MREGGREGGWEGWREGGSSGDEFTNRATQDQDSGIQECIK